MRRITGLLVLIGLILLVACGKQPESDALRTKASAQLYEIMVRSARKSDKKTLVLFVHGVTGGVTKTWGSPTHPGSWPVLLASDESLPGVDVYSFGYYTPKISKAANIEELAVRMLGQLIEDGKFRDYERIVFIGHSMGGLITKKALTKLALTDPEKLQKVKVVIFLATPSYGSSLAELASWISMNPQIRDMGPSDFNTFLQSVDNDWTALRLKRNAAAPFPLSYCAYEELPLAGSYGLLQPVPRSAVERNCDEPARSFTKDHQSMAEVTGRDDVLYRFVRQKIHTAFNLDVVVADCVRRREPEGLSTTKRGIVELQLAFDEGKLSEGERRDSAREAKRLAEALSKVDDNALSAADRTIKYDHMAVAYKVASEYLLADGSASSRREALALATKGAGAGRTSVELLERFSQATDCEDFQDWLAKKKPAQCLYWHKASVLAQNHHLAPTAELMDELSNTLEKISCPLIRRQSNAELGALNRVDTARQKVLDCTQSKASAGEAKPSQTCE